MKLQIITVPCLSDNYSFLVHNPESSETLVVDVPEYEPVMAELIRRDWKLSEILITHHHHDHIAGVDRLRSKTGASVVGSPEDSRRLPKLDMHAQPGDNFSVCGVDFYIFAAHGHTIGHIAFVTKGAAFTGDSLMALGCGRLFEGDATMMHQTLSNLAALPADTMIYSGHEYTEANARFALTIEPSNSALKARQLEIQRTRTAGKPTIPSLLSLELETNPFLRTNRQSVRETLGMFDASDTAVLAEIRSRKDCF